jgi:hypothetical protein
MGQAAGPAAQQGQAHATSSNSSSFKCTHVVRWLSASGINFQELSGSLGDLGELQPLRCLQALAD